MRNRHQLRAVGKAVFRLHTDKLPALLDGQSRHGTQILLISLQSLFIGIGGFDIAVLDQPGVYNGIRICNRSAARRDARVICGIIPNEEGLILGGNRSIASIIPGPGLLGIRAGHIHADRDRRSDIDRATAVFNAELDHIATVDTQRKRRELLVD